MAPADRPTIAQLEELRALCAGPTGANPEALIMVERRSMLVVLDELVELRQAVQLHGTPTVRLSVSTEAAASLAGHQALERAARECDAKAEGIRRTNTYRGKVNQTGEYGAQMADDCAKQIRALILTPPTGAAP